MYSALNICTHTLAHQYMCSVPDQGQVILYCRRVPWPQQSVRFVAVAVVAAVDSWSLAQPAAAAASAAPQLRLPLLICWFHFGLFVSFVFVFADFNAKPSGGKGCSRNLCGRNEIYLAAKSVCTRETKRGFRRNPCLFTFKCIGTCSFTFLWTAINSKNMPRIICNWFEQSFADILNIDTLKCDIYSVFILISSLSLLQKILTNVS